MVAVSEELKLIEYLFAERQYTRNWRKLFRRY